MSMRLFNILPFFFAVLFVNPVFSAETGHRIEIKINDFDHNHIFLGYHLGSKQYIRDTVNINDKGLFVFEGEEEIEGGMYLVILPPENQYFEILIGSKDDQYFSVETSKDDFISKAKILNSQENIRFFDYLRYIGANKTTLQELKEEEKAETNTNKIQKLQDQIDQINDEVHAYQNKITEDYPASLLAAIIKLSTPSDIPAPPVEMTEEEESDWRFRYYKSHFFDPLNFDDERLLRTPFFESKIDQYVNKLTVTHPDSIVVSLERIISLTESNPEIFKFTLVHFLNEYAKSKIVGMDGVYVYLIENYYAKGKADWVEEDMLKKMLKRARELKPLLVGKTAPDIKIKTFDGKPTSLYAVKSPFTVLYFWDPNCGHCNKMAPEMVSFSENYKDKGVRIFSVCTKDREPEICAEAVIEKGFTNWINTVALGDKELYYRLNYNIRSTPVIYVLDENKIILSKKIGASQLTEVLDMLMKQKKAQLSTD